jgi:hypothetical protein
MANNAGCNFCPRCGIKLALLTEPQCKTMSDQPGAPVMKKPCAEAAAVEAGVRAAAAEDGITLRVKQMVSGPTASLHWMFDDESGRRLLDYWPGNGTTRDHQGKKVKAGDAWHALELARLCCCATSL